MVKSQATTIRTTISVRRDLKSRMDKVKEPVNWSGLAAEAFERKLAEIENKKENPEMSGVIERLRASKRESETQEYQTGWDAGKEWTEKYAEVSQLKRLEAWRDDGSQDECRYEVSRGNAFDAAEHLAFALCPGEKSCSEAREFWDCAVGDDVPHDDIAQPEFLRGFVEGALDVWNKVKDQI
jgi:hypothetical protein